jgi:thiamine pyrophosphokinase
MSTMIVRSPDPVALVGGADVEPELLNILQSRTKDFVAADGGADHLFKAGMTPTAIIGDMDSVSDKARAAFCGVMHRSTDQNTTDFQKAVHAIESPLVLAAGFLGGRLDHTYSVLNTMSRAALRHVILVSNDDVCFLARQTCTHLRLPVGTRVGLLPTSARVDTRGLKWDIKDAAMASDGYISTSNETAKDDVEIYAVGMLFITLPLSALDVAIGAVHAR